MRQTPKFTAISPTATTSGSDCSSIGLTEMRRRGELRRDADPRHLAVSLVTAHQGGALLTFITDDAEPLRAALFAAVEYVRSFANTPEAPGIWREK